MRDNLKPVLDGRKARDTFLYGLPGTGKTCIARYLLEELGKKSGRVKKALVGTKQL